MAPDWLDERFQWYLDLGMSPDRLRLRPHARRNWPIMPGLLGVEYLFPMGWSELEGIANRTDFDLRRHTEVSGTGLEYFDEETKEHYVPYVIEPSAGADRAILAFLLDAYREEPDKDETRVVLKFHPRLAPYKVAVLPLSKKEELSSYAREIWRELRQHWVTDYDESKSIGRRYRRQDEIGTPCCVTVDFQSLEDHAVTIRDRDSMSQVRVPVAELEAALREKLGF